MASPVGEDNWLDFVDQRSHAAKNLEDKVHVIETFKNAVLAEPGSLKIWLAYCKYFWSLRLDCQAGSGAGWPIDEQIIGRDIFTLDAALKLWQRGYEEVQYRLADSHQLWNHWVYLEMELLKPAATEAGIRRITHLFKNRLITPHTTWDHTSQMFSNFLSEYNPRAYEAEMEQATRNARDAKRLCSLRDPWELKLSQAAGACDIESMRHILSEYLDWEIMQHKSNKARRDIVINFQICLGLFSRALTGIMSSDDATWGNFITLISTTHTDLKAKTSKVPEILVPKMLDVLQRAVRHIPWSGPVWARYILAAEEARLPFSAVESIKHAATNSDQLDKHGMEGVLDMYSAWCGYLKRTAMNPNATEEAVDIADAGLATALDDVKHWGNRQYRETYQGDPHYRLEKILIQFLTEKKDDIPSARKIWEELSQIPLHRNSYDFWLNWYLWEMVAFTASKHKVRSPTPVTLAQGLRVPNFATRVFIRALKERNLDWPERVMQIFEKHCNDYETAETLREAHDTIFKTSKGVAKRREREEPQVDAAHHAEYTAGAASRPTQDVIMEDVVDRGSPESKRKREATPSDDGSNKRAKSEANGVEPKRDREHTSIFLWGLPTDVTKKKIEHFFREYGQLVSIDLKKRDNSVVAMVEFKIADDARAALLRDGKFFEDQVVQVTPAVDCTLYVTNYPPEADEKYIRNLFAEFGEIHDIRLPNLKYNTRRRFCYVVFRHQASAAAALKLHGTALKSGKYTLSVQISNPTQKKSRSGALAEGRELHVANLPRSMTEDEFTALFEKAGTVDCVRILHDKNGKSKGHGFVIMETPEQAQEAIKTLDMLIFGQNPIKVELAKAQAAKTASTRSADGAEGSSAAASPADSSSEPTSSKPSRVEVAARTIAVLGIPDTMTRERVESILAPTGNILKLTLHPQHGGAIVEYPDAPAAGKALLSINGMQLDDGSGQKLRAVEDVSELFKAKVEKRPELERIDRIPLPSQKKKPTAAELMPPPPRVQRPKVLGSGGKKRGLGFIGGVAPKKDATGTTATSTPTTTTVMKLAQWSSGMIRASGIASLSPLIRD
ncbi:squamous cell carcinoma antigen recognized by T-cells 3 [Podospora fimiseda]|uniref:U4/U6 snRNA-associated-splicing factor PRP24 n=1 Tax=Podospora fimiseda TaxID=252190 RepID=A0AAN7BSI6_9PEZI|nr:squamous cell carcinoma antigen recognized by T-cells 3 [Podospora fimiseda]